MTQLCTLESVIKWRNHSIICQGILHLESVPELGTIQTVYWEVKINDQKIDCLSLQHLSLMKACNLGASPCSATIPHVTLGKSHKPLWSHTPHLSNQRVESSQLEMTAYFYVQLLMLLFQEWLVVIYSLNPLR